MNATSLTEFVLPGSPDKDAEFRELREKIANHFVKLVEDGVTESVALDVLLDSNEIHDLMFKINELVPRAPWKRIKPENRFQTAVFLDPTLAKNVRSAVQIANETSEAVAGGDRNQPTDVSNELRARNPLWFFEDPTLPPTFVNGLLAARRAELAHSLLHYFTTPLIRSIEISRSLSGLWVEDMKKYAVFVASSPGAKVSEKLVSMKDRKDLQGERDRRGVVLETLSKV